MKLDLIHRVQRRAAAEAKNSIRNSTATIQNAAAFGSVLRPESLPCSS